MKKTLKNIWDVIRGGWYLTFIISARMGFETIFNCPTANETNIIVLIASLFAVTYGIKNFIKLAKEVWNKIEEIEDGEE